MRMHVHPKLANLMKNVFTKISQTIVWILLIQHKEVQKYVCLINKNLFRINYKKISMVSERLWGVLRYLATARQLNFQV